MSTSRCICTAHSNAAEAVENTAITPSPWRFTSVPPVEMCSVQRRKVAAQ